jgi:hypothetical protein
MYWRAKKVLCAVVCWDCNVLNNTAAGSSWFEGVVSHLDNWSTTEEGGSPGSICDYGRHRC